jgi:hypothetical protein
MPSKHALSNWQEQLFAGIREGAKQADPDLAEVIDLATEVVHTERAPGGALDPNTPSTFRIADLKQPLRAYLFYRRHPLLTLASPAGILALVFLLGRASVSRSTR